MLQIGLNPYGIGYVIGLYGRGTPRQNPRPIGLDGFVDLARKYGLAGIEVPVNLAAALPDAQLKKLREEIRAQKWFVVISDGPPPGPIETSIQVAQKLGARLIRTGLTTVLCGARAERGEEWRSLIASIKQTWPMTAKKAAAHGLELAVENHQDFTSDELLELCDIGGSNVGVCLDTGNPLAVGEDPLAFARKVAPHIKHVHLKDYRAHWSNEGYRLVRCAIGNGAIPFKSIAAVLTAAGAAPLPVAIEPGALNARHVRLLSPDWWNGYAPRSATELTAALAAARIRRMDENEEWRTPWEMEADSDAIIAFELQQLEESVRNLRELGLME